MEAYGTPGGRIQSYRKDGLSWEKGAGRIHSSHKMVNALVDKYGLTKIKIPEATAYLSDGVSTNNHWPAIATVIIESFSQFSKQELQLHTLEELLTKVLKGDTVLKMISQFAYTSEITSLRADLALESLRSELGAGTGFYTLAEGIQAITDNLMKEAEETGVKFFFNHRLTSIEHGLQTKLHFSKVEFSAKKVILAIHSEGLKGLAPFKNLPILKKIQMNPLLRIYGAFSEPWFENIQRTVTDSPLRHVIPINRKKGTIMTSYTDGEDTKFWMNILKRYGEKGVSKRIIEESEELFQKKIPEPHIFKMYYWKEGCSYWLPGLYDVHEYSKAIMQPLVKNPNIFVTGESYAVNQCWVESALEHTTEMLNRYIL
jgi:protoporphyrinogen oxidase